MLKLETVHLLNEYEIRTLGTPPSAADSPLNLLYQMHIKRILQEGNLREKTCT